MPVESTLQCGDVRKRLQSFLEDLLSEDEYRAFVGHLDACPPCEKHVRSIGDLSNQIWKLGKVKVPSDLGDTALFKLRHPQPQVETPTPAMPAKKWALWAALLILVGVCVFFTGHYFKTRASSQSTPQTPAITMVPVDINESLEEAAAPVETKPAPGTLETSEKRPVARPSAQKKVADQTDSVSETKPLHWHIVYSEDAENPTPLQLRQQAAELKAGARPRILDALSASGARFESQPSDMIIFRGSGNVIERSLENVLSICEEIGSLEDFTAGAPTFPDKEQPASIYFDIKGAPLHWHFSSLQADQKEKLFGVIREMGGSIGYDSGGLAVFLVSRTEIKKLRLRMKAMRLDFSEFGSLESQGDTLSNALTPISVYFGA